jgi:hypothetical protein
MLRIFCELSLVSVSYSTRKSERGSYIIDIMPFSLLVAELECVMESMASLLDPMDDCLGSNVCTRGQAPILLKPAPFQSVLIRSER